MVTAGFILIFSTGLFSFFLQAVCQKILRRQFAQDYFQFIAYVNHLEFPSVRKAFVDCGAPPQYPRLLVMLSCDFLVLTYLLKNAANPDLRYAYEDWLLILYFKLVFVFLYVCHQLKLREASAALKLTVILQHFANVVGERVDRVRFGNLAASDFFLNR